MEAFRLNFKTLAMSENFTIIAKMFSLIEKKTLHWSMSMLHNVLCLVSHVICSPLNISFDAIGSFPGCIIFCFVFVFRIWLASSIEMVAFWSLSSIHFLLCQWSSLDLWALCSYSQFLVLCVLRIRCHYCCMGVEAMGMDLEAIILLGTPNLLKLPSSS
jgi:hypothetical protein